jgi:hypothetical protein
MPAACGKLCQCEEKLAHIFLKRADSKSLGQPHLKKYEKKTGLKTIDSKQLRIRGRRR